MRVKRGVVSRQKHNKTLKLAEGYRGSRSTLIRTAKQAVLQAGQYAYAGRKNRKRDYRSLWITRISEASKSQDLSYSVFMNRLSKANIELDRKMIADLVVNDPETFTYLVEMAKKAN
ncbi:MAG TPA: 50S ribosomal protein L20 [Candidatus Saccharimonadales bacterium]|nr:50S ribosomal protein L20 [Candidatus Saccharimonadales bacterium]